MLAGKHRSAPLKKIKVKTILTAFGRRLTCSQPLSLGLEADLIFSKSCQFLQLPAPTALLPTQLRSHSTAMSFSERQLDYITQ